MVNISMLCRYVKFFCSIVYIGPYNELNILCKQILVILSLDAAPEKKMCIEIKKHENHIKGFPPIIYLKSIEQMNAIDK